MTTINRDQFARNLGQNGGYIDLQNMSDGLERAFQASGITDEQLRQIAGQDRVIRGSREFKNLFTCIDRAVTDGHKGKIAKSGVVYDALNRQVEANRARAAKEGGKRFAGDDVLARVAQGKTRLQEGSRGEHVRHVQQALVDMGYNIPTKGTNGVYGKETKRAVERFQRDAGIAVDGRVGSETLGALSAMAPPPGHRLERSAEYDRLYADGRLDTTIAIGFDEDGGQARAERETLSGLRTQGYKPINPSKMSQEDRRRLGLDGDRFDPNARYFHRQFKDPDSGRNIDGVVRLLLPGRDGARARASFEKALRYDEVVIYTGHARYGTGPDFDHINSGKGNFVIGTKGNETGHRPPAGLRTSIRGRQSDLMGLKGRPDYQVLVFNACRTENYLKNLRSSRLWGRDFGNTDIITTTIPLMEGTGSAQSTRILQGLTSRESNNKMLRAASKIEQEELQRFGFNSEVPAAAYSFNDSGFVRNKATRVVPTEATR